MQSRRGRLHIVLFPWLAFGHLIPYLELAKLIAAKGYKVSFVSSARNIDRLPKVPTHLSRFLNLVKLQLPASDGNIPNDAEATIDVPYDKVQYLKRAYDGLERQMVEFLEGERPDWILHDFAAYWVSSVAKKLGIGCAYFSIFVPALACMTVPTSHLLHVEDDRRTPEDFTVPPKWIPFETKVAFRYFEIAKIFDAVDDSNVSGISDLERANESTRGCDLMCVRGCSQLDGQWFQLAEKLHGKPVIPVGQLPTTPSDQQEDDASKTKEWLRIKAWLDQHEAASTVYVSFGSEAKPTQEEVTELAYGLEMSGLPFFWVLRTRRGSSDEDVVKLPEGFEERVAGRGVVYTTWVPQLKILSHESVGGFLSHAGWSSVVEAMQYSKALMLVTFLADQGLNARVLEEKMMAYSVPRREKDGWFSRESVADSLRLVVVEEEGKAYRDKAKEMSKLFGDAAVQDGYVNSLLDYLQSH
uniref:Uncharacterized protein n=1 Tax=Kalanchoe fedtschenkoi TaxID=63787 RepID=A0A7N0ZUZ4_KALFE